ncbi:hypothetical protein MKZ38_001880 [Zalerion maritima]|uniref:Uncharacterized protein n=1 Tax=Zalerion maritima TaxID=339359 RepID=A0AAD5WSW0_9PEZI|nr:hypothetical protein MKZ38_001880 [Zalerion maritima]
MLRSSQDENFHMKPRGITKAQYLHRVLGGRGPFSWMAIHSAARSMFSQRNTLPIGSRLLRGRSIVDWEPTAILCLKFSPCVDAIFRDRMLCNPDVSRASGSKAFPDASTKNPHHLSESGGRAKTVLGDGTAGSARLGVLLIEWSQTRASRRGIVAIVEMSLFAPGFPATKLQPHETAGSLDHLGNGCSIYISVPGRGRTENQGMHPKSGVICGAGSIFHFLPSFKVVIVDEAGLNLTSGYSEAAQD